MTKKLLPIGNLYEQMALTLHELLMEFICEQYAITGSSLFQEYDLR